MSLAKSIFNISALDKSLVSLDYFSENLLESGDIIREKLNLDNNALESLKIYIKDDFLHIKHIFPVCPFCGSSNVKSNGWKDRKLVFPDSGKEIVKVQKYKCLNKCNEGKIKYFATNLDSTLNGTLISLKSFKEGAVNLYEVGTISLRNSVELIFDQSNTKVSHQSIEN